MTSYYDILECSPESTYEELKRSYQELAKKFHPDRNSSESNQKFLQLDKAWKTLRDADSRKIYDESLAKNGLSDSPVYCEIFLREMDFESTSAIYTYPCRCGGVYLINEHDVREVDQVQICCDECSFHIIVNKSEVF